MSRDEEQQEQERGAQFAADIQLHIRRQLAASNEPLSWWLGFFGTIAGYLGGDIGTNGATAVLRGTADVIARVGPAMDAKRSPRPRPEWKP